MVLCQPCKLIVAALLAGAYQTAWRHLPDIATRLLEYMPYYGTGACVLMAGP
jgi:hypothetical protein